MIETPKEAPKVEIGRLYTGQHFQHFDTRAGTYWEVLPPITGDNLLVQRALLAPVRHRRAYTVAVPLVPASKAPAMPPVAPAKPASEAHHVPPRPMPAASAADTIAALKPGHGEDLSALEAERDIYVDGAQGVATVKVVESEQGRMAKRIDDLNAERVAAGLPRTIRV